jgi:hypothetical protein
MPNKCVLHCIGHQPTDHPQLKNVLFAITVSTRVGPMSVPIYKKLDAKIDLKQLRYAVAAADHGSFRRAAEALNVEQSTLSRAILQLEHATSTRIFERSPGGVTVSTSGSELVWMARAVLEQIN